MRSYSTSFDAADETAMIALSASRGDCCVRADCSALFVLDGADPSVAASWKRLPGLARLIAASNESRNAALLLASIDLDAGGPWQGRKYDELGGLTGTVQEREFPRVPCEWTEERFGCLSLVPSAQTVWDWDAVNQVAIVPPNVILAVLFQADSELAADREGRIQAIADGLSAQTVGSLSESYRQSAQPQRLCVQTSTLMQRYRLRTGNFL